MNKINTLCSSQHRLYRAHYSIVCPCVPCQTVSSVHVPLVPHSRLYNYLTVYTAHLCYAEECTIRTCLILHATHYLDALPICLRLISLDCTSNHQHTQYRVHNSTLCLYLNLTTHAIVNSIRSSYLTVQTVRRSCLTTHDLYTSDLTYMQVTPGFQHMTIYLYKIIMTEKSTRISTIYAKLLHRQNFVGSKKDINQHDVYIQIKTTLTQWHYSMSNLSSQNSLKILQENLCLTGFHKVTSSQNIGIQ